MDLLVGWFSFRTWDQPGHRTWCWRTSAAARPRWGSGSAWPRRSHRWRSECRAARGTHPYRCRARPVIWKKYIRLYYHFFNIIFKNSPKRRWRRRPRCSCCAKWPRPRRQCSGQWPRRCIPLAWSPRRRSPPPACAARSTSRDPHWFPELGSIRAGARRRCSLQTKRARSCRRARRWSSRGRRLTDWLSPQKRSCLNMKILAKVSLAALHSLFSPSID